MSYGGQDIGTLRFLAANVVYQATGALLKPDSGDEADRGVLDDMVLMLDMVSSYYTENDEKFAAEWRQIHEDRRKAMSALKPGFELEPAVLEGFRWREGKAMFRALCRQGTFVRQESPAAEWVPTVKPRGA